MTEEEIKEDEHIKQWMDGVIKARRKINEIHGKQRGVVGHITCPLCGGRLRYVISKYNGHVHGACEKEDCLRWME